MAVLGTCLQARRDSLISFGVDLTGSEEEIAKREKDIDAAKVLLAERAEAFKAERRKTSYKKTSPTELFLPHGGSLFGRLDERALVEEARGLRPCVLMRLMEAFTATEDAASSLGDRYFVEALRAPDARALRRGLLRPLGLARERPHEGGRKLAPLNKLFADAGSRLESPKRHGPHPRARKRPNRLKPVAPAPLSRFDRSDGRGRDRNWSTRATDP